MMKYLLAIIFTTLCVSAQAQTFFSAEPQTKTPPQPAQNTVTTTANAATRDAAVTSPQEKAETSTQNMSDKAERIYAGQIATAEAKRKSEREYDKNLKDIAERADISERKETVRNLKALNNRYPELFQGGEDIDIQDTKAYTDYIKTKMTPPKEEE